eukprot:403332043
MDYSASKLAGFCSDQSAIYKNLKPGTSCQYDYQCSCQRCEDYICRGAFAGDPCRTNVECSSNYFCGSVISQNLTWKFCIPAKKLNETCSSDWECQNQLICARTNSTDSTKCMTRWSLFEGTYSVDPRLCMSGYTTTKGICSHILQVYQAKNTTLTCDINTNKGGCVAIFSIDGSNRTDLVPCQCSIFDSTTSYCRWPGLSSQLRYLQLLQKLYSQSPYCSRAYFNDDPLQIKFAELKQCTSLDQDTFSELVQYAHKWLYAAPLKSPLYNEECLNEFAVTSPKLMGMIRTQANYEIQMENALVNQLCIVLNILLVLTYVLF